MRPVTYPPPPHFTLVQLAGKAVEVDAAAITLVVAARNLGRLSVVLSDWLPPQAASRPASKAGMTKLYFRFIRFSSKKTI
ncbi:hypothetical protein RugamoR1_07480 [Rugamonas sp. R1(2021)]